MQSELKEILEIQEIDMKMLRLLRLKKDRQNEHDKLGGIKTDLHHKAQLKEGEITEAKKNIRIQEMEVKEVQELIKKLESQQSAVKKVEEFNALNHEMSHAERQRVNKEQFLSDMYDKVSELEEMFNSLKETLEQTIESSKSVEKEIIESIEKINEEGKVLLAERKKVAAKADPEVFEIYERLLQNKRDRVVVPVESRCCSGCHILITAQDENLIRKGEGLIFCEHCSRIHYWPEEEAAQEPTADAPKTRRRRTVKK